MKKERKTAHAALRRGMAFLCTLVLALMAVTLPAEAVGGSGLTFQDIDLSENVCQPGTDPKLDGETNPKDRESLWEANGTEITGTVKPAIYYGKHLGAKRYQSEAGANSTLTITNTGGEACLLTFSYAPPSNGGTLSFSPESVASDGTCRAILDPNKSVTVTLTSKQKTGRERNLEDINDTTIATLSNIEWTSMNTNISVTFMTAEGGRYYAETADGGKLPMGDTYTKPRNTEYKFTAVPDPDYNFVGWYVDSQKRSEALTFETGFTDSCTVVAQFVSKNAALFKTGGERFYDLNEAVAYAQANRQQQITLESNGKITGHYTIPAGITLLIPFDDKGTLYTNKPGCVTTEETPEAYRILTMAPDSSITVDGGAISVGGKHFAGSFGSCCKATGRYGQIIMQEGSAIMLKSGANLYAWGYITGDGEITATSDATVYEYFQVADWRGGNAVLKMISSRNNHVFPFSQYYVQNIEAPLTIQNGATEKAYFSVDADVVGTNSVTIEFIGSKKSLFRIYDGGELTKKYDPKTDRITYTTTGSASLDSLAISLAGIYTINSKNYVLPVNNNMTLEILSGKVAVNCDAALLPGAQITIAQGAELSVSDGKSLYVYDQNQWGPYCAGANQFVPVPYSPSEKGTRTLANATINVNGTLTAAGSIYTTESGANICSSEGGGRFVLQNEPDNKSTTHQATQKGSDVSYDDIPITPAQLKNAAGADEPYTKTSTAKAGDTFTYCKGQECSGGKWVKNLQVAAINNNDGTQVTTHETLQEAVDRFSQDSSGNTYIKMLHSTTEEINAQSDLYLDLNGCTVTGNFAMNSKTLYGMDSKTDEYNGAKAGKIVGSVVPYAKTFYQTPPVPVNGHDTYKRYVAIPGLEADGKANLSFHRFNISVTGYRFELTSGDTPQCALFFIGKFRGDEEAKKHLKSLGFTLTGGNGTGPKEFSCEMPQALGNEVFSDKDGAFLFEVYLKRSFGKDASAASFTEGISATAKATFQNQGVLGEQLSNERTLSFKEAWEKADNLDPAQKAIIDKILREHGINQ